MSLQDRSSLLRLARIAACAALVGTLPLALVAGTATAQEGAQATTSTAASTPAASAYLVAMTHHNDRQVTLAVHSPSMGRTIPVDVILPHDPSVPRPVYYLLNGAGGGEDSASWEKRTDLLAFFEDKNVNVVTPIGGMLSFYTDWQKDDPELGRHQWTTFLTKELPPVVNKVLNTNGVNAIAGLSMTGTSVLNLAIAAPGLFKAAGSFSGCAQVSDPFGQQYVRTVVEMRGGGDTTNMWGPYGGPGWVANDPLVNAEKLRGTALYFSAGNGLPGPHETLDDKLIDGNVGVLVNQAVVGGAIEVAMNLCTRNMQARLAELGIPATFNFRDSGTHSWGYWEDDLRISWPLIAQAIGAS